MNPPSTHPLPRRFLSILCSFTTAMAWSMPASCPATVEQAPVKAFADGTAVRALSPAPKPGVHPRIFLSPDDLPELRRLATTSPARMAAYQALRKTVAEKLDNPATPEGRVLATMAKGGAPTDAQFAGAADLGYLLSLAAIDAQIANDAARGKFLGQVLSAYGANQLRAWVRRPDPVGLHNSWNAGFCLAYDFLAPWMSEGQRVPVRRFIAKMMDGINIFTHDWPAHMRMWNWAGLHVYQGWGTLAIEGEEGWNPKLWNQAREVARDFCRYNIHESGALTEDLTYFTLGMQGSGLVMMAMAKRGEAEVWATGSNVSKLKYHLANQLHPWGGNFMSHQDGGGNGFYATWTILKYMYPTDPLLDYAWRERVGPDYGNGGMGNDASIRAWLMVLFNTEYLDKPVPPNEWKLATTYFCPKRSYLITRTGWDANALKLDFEAKTDYPTVGHNHADANNFTFAALGREWATEFGYHGAAGHLHNNVVIDGRSESGWPTPGGRWVDLVDTPEVTIGVSDARHPYTWQWSDSGYGSENNAPEIPGKWERETQPDVVEFARAQAESGKGSQTIFEHYGPVIRSAWNPVEKAYRTAALVRGKRPYALIVDDIRKDEQTHLYQWAMQMPDDVEIIRGGDRRVILGTKDLPPAKGKNAKNTKDAKPQPDKRRLLVQIVDIDLPSERDGLAIALESSQLGNGAFEQGGVHKRLVIPARSAEPRFKILLYPHLEGDPLPDVLWNDERSACELVFPDQTDRLAFAPAADGRSAMSVSRDGKLLATVKVAPAAPAILTTTRVFTERQRVELALPGAAQEIRYTLDGSEPTVASPLYTGPFSVDAAVTLKAATFARRWAFGDDHRSAVSEARFVKQTPRPAAGRDSNKPGLNATVYEGFWNNLPDFTALKPLAKTVVETVALPPGTPAKGFGLVLEGELRVPADGVYTFGLNCDDAARLWIGDQLVVDHDGQHIVSTKTGEIALAAGVHALRIAHCDGALALGRSKGDGSWAFHALWAPNGAGLREIPADVLGRAAGPDLATASYPTVAARTGLRSVPGLEHATYDRTDQAGTLDFLAATGPALTEGLIDNTTTSSDHATLLHVARGFLIVPNPGDYEFALDPGAVGEVTVGDTVVARGGIPGSNLAQPVRLEKGLVLYQVKFGKGHGQVQWKGPGQTWQAIAAADVARELRPLASIAGRDLSRAGYEVFGPTPVTLGPAQDGLAIVYSLDGTDPLAGGKTYDQPLTVSAACTLRARFVAAGKPVGGEEVIRLAVSPVPADSLIGWWSADRLDGAVMKNGVAKAADLALPEGTVAIDDPEQGKVLKLDHAGKVILTRSAILANELTVSFRIKPEGEGTLVRYGYAHHGIFMNLGPKGSCTASGGGEFRAAQAQPGTLDDGRWHQVTATFGGSPFRAITLWIDGKPIASGRSKAPCVTNELEFFQGVSGLIAEVRLYNRILAADEIAALKEQPAP